ncbi:MAG: hypothetical protein ACJ76I_00060 [Gaiellaceae bacterium]
MPLIGEYRTARVTELTPRDGRNRPDACSGVLGWDEGEGHFDSAMEISARIGARPALAHAQEDYARMLLMKGDTYRTSELAEAAVSSYRALGMETYAAGAERLTQKGNGDGRP